MQGVVAPDLGDADDDDRVCDECFKSFVPGEARYHHESEDEDLCEKHYAALVKASPGAKDSFVKVVTKTK